MTQQNNEKFEVKNDKIIKYPQANVAREAFIKLLIQHIPRIEKGKADKLSEMSNSLAQHLRSEVMGQELVSQIKCSREMLFEIK